MCKEEVVEFFSKMSERTMAVFIFRFVFKLSIDETADTLKITYSSCCYHIRKIRKIYNKFDKHLDDMAELQELMIYGQIDRIMNKNK